MELVGKIQGRLEDIVGMVSGIDECSINTSDGFEIISSSPEIGKSEIDGDIISIIINFANEITGFLVKQKTEKLILDFDEKKILVIGLSNHIFLTFLTKKNSSLALILLDLKPQLKLLKNLIKSY